MEKKRINIASESRKLHFFSPATLIIVAMVVVVACFSVHGGDQYILMGFSFVICLVNVRHKIFDVIMTILVLYALLFTFFYITKLSPYMGFFLVAINLGVKLLPVIILFLNLSSYTAAEITSAFRNMKISERLSLMISIFYRYTPEFRAQMKDIRNGAKIRGITFSLKSPIRSFEQIIVPMLYKGLHVSDAITSSMITKGATYKGEKTNYRNIKFTKQDYILFVITIGFIGGLAWKNIF